MHGTKQPDAHERITRALRAGPLSVPQITDRVGMGKSHVNRTLAEMVDDKILRMLNTTPRTYEIRTQ